MANKLSPSNALQESASVCTKEQKENKSEMPFFNTRECECGQNKMKKKSCVYRCKELSKLIEKYNNRVWALRH